MFSVVFVILRLAWSSTYTYLLLLFVAAAFIAFVARPRGRGEVIKRLLAGTLISKSEVDSKQFRVNGARLHVHCLGAGKVIFERLDIAGLTESGAVSVAVSYKGKDVEILERTSPGYHNDTPLYGARFEIDMTGHEWRHVRWVDEQSGLWCAFSLHVREGIDFSIKLKR